MPPATWYEASKRMPEVLSQRFRARREEAEKARRAVASGAIHTVIGLVGLLVQSARFQARRGSRMAAARWEARGLRRRWAG